MTKPLTGRKVLLIALAAFAIVLTPNFVLAYFASTTFAGLVVPNSYIASQEFNARTRAQKALGWTLALKHEDSAIRLRFTDEAGATVRPAHLAVTVGRPTTKAADRSLELIELRDGAASAAAPLDPGNWIVLVEAEALDGTGWSQRHTLLVR